MNGQRKRLARLLKAARGGRSLREAEDLTDGEIKYSSIYNWERGARPSSPEDLRKLADAYGVRRSPLLEAANFGASADDEKWDRERYGEAEENPPLLQTSNVEDNRPKEQPEKASRKELPSGMIERAAEPTEGGEATGYPLPFLTHSLIRPTLPFRDVLREVYLFHHTGWMQKEKFLAIIGEDDASDLLKLGETYLITYRGTPKAGDTVIVESKGVPVTTRYHPDNSQTVIATVRHLPD